MSRGASAPRDKKVSRPGPSTLDAAFFALADGTRRAVIRELLHEALRAGELAQRVGMSPPALSRHLRVLREAGLIVEEGVEHDARVRLFNLDHAAFASVRQWLDEVEAHWREQLAAFKDYAEASRATAAKRRTRRARPPRPRS